LGDLFGSMCQSLGAEIGDADLQTRLRKASCRSETDAGGATGDSCHRSGCEFRELHRDYLVSGRDSKSTTVCCLFGAPQGSRRLNQQIVAGQVEMMAVRIYS